MSIQRKFSKLPLKNSQLEKSKKSPANKAVKSVVSKVVNDLNASDEKDSILASEGALEKDS